MQGEINQLKILHVLDHSLPLYSGYVFRSQSILKSQLKRGWRPVVVTSSKHEESLKTECLEKETIEGLTYYRSGSVSVNSFPGRREARIMSTLARRIRSVADIERPHILHAHSPVLNAIPALWVGRQLGIPVVYELRALWEDGAVDLGSYTRNSWKYQTVRALETWACRYADHLAVLCQGIKDELVRRGIASEKITIVPNAVNPEEFSPDGRAVVSLDKRMEGKKVIGFAGSFYRWEGLDLLIQALARLAAARSDVVLLLVGEGAVESELRTEVKNLGLNDLVIMPGKLSHHEVRKVYTLSDVLVYPRHSIRVTEMVTPLKPLEAMSMGRAVVASDIGGHREIIRHGCTGLLVPPGDVTQLAETLNRVLDDSDLRQRLGRAAAAWVRQERCWETVGILYDDIYATALKSVRPVVSKLNGFSR
jgi:PEP-CTERM/exosortase A-associated glycosyltransferase